MFVLKIFENTPGRPAQGRQGSCRPNNGRQDPNVIFFLEFAKRSLLGGGSLSPLQRATGVCRPTGVSHPI